MVVQETLGRSHSALCLRSLSLTHFPQTMVGTCWSLVSMCYVAKMILDLEEDDWENWIRLSMWDKVIEALIGATSYHVFSSASCHTHFGTRHCHIHYFVLYMVLYLFKYLFLIFLFKIKD